MRIAIMTDIHANLEALEVVLEAIGRAKVDLVACLGDVVGYGADPEACCALVRKHAAFTVVGNHDAAVAGRRRGAYHHEDVSAVIRAHQAMISAESMAWLRALPFEELLPEASAAFCHGSPSDPEQFYYLMRPQEASYVARCRPDLENFAATFFGHTHLPVCFEVAKDFSCEDLGDPTAIKLQPGLRYFVSVPSVGQPRDCDPRTGFVVYDSSIPAVEFVRLDYDHETAARKIFQAGLPPRFAHRLSLGV